MNFSEAVTFLRHLESHHSAVGNDEMRAMANRVEFELQTALERLGRVDRGEWNSYSSEVEAEGGSGETEQLPGDIERVIESQKRVRDAFADFIEVWKAKRLADATEKQSRSTTLGLFKRKSA